MSNMLKGAELLEAALAIAVEAHRGQRDKAGAAYILHPLRVMARVDGAEAQAAALLHDVIEDTPVTAETLAERGFPQTVIAAVLALTRRDGESYAAFIERAAADPLARRIKRADIEDNIDVLRLDALGDADLSRIKRYHAAFRRLQHD